ncbi:hypothetical protein CY35_03G095700 [Sphagnum magellanicum]|nr:hypothetical protein CY35_03G095700 [Sphagnum magellanicum]
MEEKDGQQQRTPQMRENHPGREHEGKNVLVTGGDSGIACAVGVHFSAEGATVAFAHVPRGEDTIQLLKEYKTPAAYDPLKIATDFGFDHNCRKVIDAVVEKYGQIDILVNNAAEQHTISEVQIVDTKMITKNCKRHALPHMKEGCVIINTTSVNAFKGNAKLLDYTSTKGTILAFTLGLVLQLISRGIRVNAVAPGPVWTPTTSFGEETTITRVIAPSYVFLAS